MRKTTSAPTTSSTDRNGGSFVNRWFSVEGLRNDLHPPTVNHAFAQQSGVRSVYIDIEHDRIRIHYDNTIIDIETVIEILRNAGCPSRQRFWDRLKYGWWRYLDENARGMPEAPAHPAAAIQRRFTPNGGGIDQEKSASARRHLANRVLTPLN